MGRRRLLIVLIVFVGIAGGAWWWFQTNVLSTLPTDLSRFRDWRPPLGCLITDASGEVVDEFYLERRIWVDLEPLPPFVAQAFVSAEDRRFFSHRGVDWLGTARALVENIRAGESVQGGSTITQQLVKNLLVGRERSYLRKMREAVLAYRLEDELSKPQLLELYINFVYLGAGNYGVEAAARDYYGVGAANLNAGQAALIAGLVPAPSRYSPRTNPHLAEQRRRIVLDQLVEDGHLPRETADTFLDDPVAIPRGDPTQREIGVGYITQVRRELRKVLGPQRPTVAGMRVGTPLRMDVQAVAERAVRDALEALDRRQGQRGAIRQLTPERYDAFYARAPGLRRNPETLAPLPPRRDECFEALVGRDGLGALRAGPYRFAMPEAERLVRSRDGRQGALEVQPGDVLSVCLVEDRTVRLDRRPWAEGAAIVVDHRSQRVIALVGGYEDRLEGFVRATQARRQPGSSFKLYVYAAALLHGRNQLDIVVDAPIDLPGGGRTRWRPKNFDNTYRGRLPLRTAFAKSINTVAIRLLLDVGVDDVIHTANALGVTSPLRRDPTIALGSAEVTLMEQVTAFATVARQGRRFRPVYVTSLVDAEGEPMQEVAAFAAPEPPDQVLPTGIAFELIDMLENVVRSGTARAAFDPEHSRAGKTGTTNDYVDAWFVGFTPTHTVGIWIGTDGPATLGDRETGGRAALPAWKAIVEALEADTPAQHPVPDEAVLVPFEGHWIALARGPNTRTVLPRPRRGSLPLGVELRGETRTSTAP
ncbi:MAG: PBP1A family penicillin-binding protein [Deltaproteobacteria bacterium]|jgi:penicillin-binding protein 1A